MPKKILAHLEGRFKSYDNFLRSRTDTRTDRRTDTQTDRQKILEFRTLL